MEGSGLFYRHAAIVGDELGIKHLIVRRAAPNIRGGSMVVRTPRRQLGGAASHTDAPRRAEHA